MTETLDALAGRLAGRCLAVVGEAMLDRTLAGAARRLSPERPVPVVSDPVREDRPGGAANTALNAAALGSRAGLASLVGDDEAGGLLRAALREGGVATDAVVEVAGRGTLLKTRVVADGHLLARLDQGSTAEPGPEAARRLADGLERLLETCEAAVISDYAYGAVGPAAMERLAAWRRSSRRPLVVDARDLRRHAPLAPTAAVPNGAEAERLLGLAPAEGEARVERLAAQADRLLALTGAAFVAVTLDRDGALVLRDGMAPHRILATTPRAADPVGAGDTFAAALALALAAGAEPVEAVELASHAAGVAVAKPGTATCSLHELRGALGAGPAVVASRDALARLARAHRAAGRRVVLTNGCFDVLHRGHVGCLEAARALGDALIVGVNSDASVRRLKGFGRPLNPCADRMAVLASLACVTHVAAFEEDTPEALIRAVRPDVFAKGGDYAREDLPEAALVEALGGTVHLLPYRPGHSTTGLVARARAMASGADAAE